MLALQRECMSERDPGRGETGVHQGGFAKVCPCFSPALRSEIPYADGVPAHRRFRFLFDHLMCQNEELRMKVRQVIHARDVQGHRMFVHIDKRKDALSDHETVCPFKLSVGGISEAEKHVDVILEVELFDEPFSCQRMLLSMLVFSQPRYIDEADELGVFRQLLLVS